ncbi:hypothetical protein GCM10009716_26860 [Streptomyces sodiiphilus]|uniref:Lipoprotein n=1 Tax=Streptomyces sodiiphilus TaxID=226217 RepID=A0ABN2PBN3_9ACTN
MRTRARLAVSAAAISAALLLSACGSDDGGKESAGAGGDNGSRDTAEPADDEDGSRDDERDAGFGDDTELGEFHGFWKNDAGDTEGILVITGEHVQFFAGEEGGENGISCMGGLGNGGVLDLFCGSEGIETMTQEKGRVTLNSESNLTFTWASGESGTYSKELNPLGD